MLHTDKGYSVLEMLICILILSWMMLLTISHHSIFDFEHFNYLNDYLIKQSQAILYKERRDCSKGIYFNEMGHINQARTIYFTSHELILHLGNGYATYR